MGRIDFRHGPAIRSMSAHRKRPSFLGLKISWEHYVFMVLYALALQQCYITMGQPYANAVAHHKAMQEALAQANAAALNTTVVHETDAGSVPVAPPEPDDFDPFAELSGGKAEEGAEAAATTWGDSVKFGGQDDDEDGPPMPSPLMPSFYAILLTAVVAILHILSQLAQHWSIGVKVFVNCLPATDVRPGTILKLVPPLHQGKAQLVPVEEFDKADKSKGMFFMFQRQRYELEADASAKDGAAWNVVELPYPTGKPVTFYLAAPGLSAADCEAGPGTLFSRFGRNDFSIPLPTILSLFKEQLLGPVTQFQLFSALLWLLDEYWKYALFHVGMIFMFEATTAFSRQRSLQTLRGMGAKARTLKAFRGGKWVDVSTDTVLPGDIISLVKSAADEESVVPADCVILSGGAVVNEANLTGESVPQMKEEASADHHTADTEPLDMMGAHRIHTLYSGTTLMQHTGGRAREAAGKASARPAPPDGGVVCFVLRTGFASSQGALMRMIEFSQEQVTGDTRETLVLLLILLVFAVLSAGHVLNEGLKAGKRSHYELMLRCVLILTSVVPPDLPMQTALAVNTSLMALHKQAIFCTEPYRIPYAGKVDTCLFDKTGTLTTDKLKAIGVVNWPQSGSPDGSSFSFAAGEGGGVRPLTDMDTASQEVCCVLAGCHALLEVDGKLMGDPIETSGLKAVDFDFKPATSTAAPAGKKIKKRPWGSSDAALAKPTIKILHRYHFSSALQRMSVLARVALSGATEAQTWALVKGSPEAIGALLADKPKGYDATYRAMAERGMRVLALAVKSVAPPAAGETLEREEVESGLRLCGFVAFSCLTRSDTELIVHRLQHGAAQVAMVTGDAALTALHVAREVGICDAKVAPEMPLVLDAPKGAGGALEWVSARLDKNGREAHRAAYSAAGMAGLVAKGHDLMMTGPGLRAACAAEEATWTQLHLVKVFARMSPEDKEAVLKAMRANGRYTMMCGDGANDVGALKQAHVGLALLSGFGDMNTKKLSDEEKAKKKADAAKAAEESRKQLQAKWQEERQKEKDELIKLQTVYVEEEMKRFEGQAWQQMKALRAASTRLYAEQKRRHAERVEKFGGQQVAAQAAITAQLMEGLDEGDIPRVKLGDASIAAPFTSKMPSIAAAVDIVRQGRCALVNTTQQQQILALNCLISAYSLAALYLDGIKSGEAQMIATGVLLTVAGMAFSFARPVEELSPVQPLRSVFHPAYSLSLVGQLAIHLYCMYFAFNMAHEFEPSGPGSCTQCGPARPPLSEGTGFLAEVSKAMETELAKQRASEGLPTEGGYKFQPSLLNTCVFLVTSAQQVSVMFVNYKGRPFMQGISENPAFLWSITLCCGGAFVCAFERMPELNQVLQLVSMPNDEFRWTILRLLAATTGGAFLWDRLMLLLFARPVFLAALKASRPDPWALLKSTKKGFLYIFVGGLVMGSGFSVPMLLVVYFLYKKGVFN